MAWVPGELSRVAAREGIGVVIDVVRATTTIATALSAGARRVVPFESVEEAREAARRSDAVLCGERAGRPPEGFERGNSPSAYTAERVAGRDLAFTTTNGTAAMRSMADAGFGDIRLACFRNLRVVTDGLLAADTESVLVACAGRQGRVGMDDAWCAGHLVDRLIGASLRPTLTDGALAACRLATRLGRPTAGALEDLAAGRALVEAGLRADLADCARVDDLEVAPVWDGGAFVTGGEEEGT